MGSADEPEIGGVRGRFLIKFVLVDEGGNWFEMSNCEEVIRDWAARVPGTHVEKWVYPILEEGHGTPTKTRR